MSNEKKYFWLKLKEDFFNQKEIKKLRKIAGGDTFTIIYLKMQLLSLRNCGILKYEGTEKNLAEQLSLEIDEDIDNIQVTLNFLEQNNLMESSRDYEYLLIKASECIGKEGASAERVRKFRERKKNEIILKENVVNNEKNGSETLLCNTAVTKCNTEIEIEKEIDIDFSISKDILVGANAQLIIEKWNSLGLQKILGIKNNRSKLLKARIKEYGLDNILKAIDNIKSSSFLQGQNNRSWIITFDWFIRPNNFPKVLEGCYSDARGGVLNGTSKFAYASGKNEEETKRGKYSEIEDRISRKL